MTDPSADPAVTESFKEAMRLMASTVSVVAACHKGRRFGLTATSVCSLTMEPPQILACVNRSGDTHDCIADSGYFSVNPLQAGQDDVSNTFAATATDDGPDQFDRAGNWDTWDHDVPRLRNALASIYCEVAQAVPADTHTVYIGRVLAVQTTPGATPLLYANRGYTVPAS